MPTLDNMTAYFNAEKQESLLFIAVGLLATAVAAWLWMNGHRLKSMAFPLVAVAVIHGVVGSTVYFRTDRQLAQLSQQLATAPAQYKAAETQRMAVVMPNFKLYAAVEIALLALGVLMLVFARLVRSGGWHRCGSGAAVGFHAVPGCVCEKPGQAQAADRCLPTPARQLANRGRSWPITGCGAGTGAVRAEAGQFAACSWALSYF